jgi:hypothetical protein
LFSIKIVADPDKPRKKPHTPFFQSLYTSDTDCWAERGDQNTLANLANEELEQYDLAFQQARNDRAGGAQLVYTMLQTGELVNAATCQNVMRAIESRVHDKKEPLKVEKVVGDPYDDVWDALRYATLCTPTASPRRSRWRCESRTG